MVTIDQIRPFLKNARNSTSNQLLSDCPFCLKQGHFYLNRTTFLWICHKCGEAGNLFALLRQVDGLHLLQGHQVDFSRLKDLDEQMFTEEELEIDIADSSLPPGFTKVRWADDGNPFVDYLKGRKYTKQDFQLYQPGYTELIDKYAGYILIPMYRDWSVKGFLARNICDDDRPRYQNKKGVKFTKLLDGLDLITANTHTVIMVEGHFDKISVSNELDLEATEQFRVLNTFGKKVSSYQFELLSKTNVRDIYLFFDSRDAVAEIKKSGYLLAKQFKVLGCFDSTKKDGGEMTGPEIIQVLQGAEPIQQYMYNYVQTNKLK